MIEAGLSVRYGPLTWFHNKKTYILQDRVATKVGRMLLDECVKSVCYRYNDSEMTNLPGRTNAEWLIPFQYRAAGVRPNALEAMKITQCYVYQSCEHPEWKRSQAKVFCDTLIRCLINMLPGYDDAPWDWDEK